MIVVCMLMDWCWCTPGCVLCVHASCSCTAKSVGAACTHNWPGSSAGEGVCCVLSEVFCRLMPLHHTTTHKMHTHTHTCTTGTFYNRRQHTAHTARLATAAEWLMCVRRLCCICSPCHPDMLTPRWQVLACSMGVVWVGCGGCLCNRLTSPQVCAGTPRVG